VSSIGVLREGPLHAAVKAMLASPGDRLEVPVDRFVSGTPDQGSLR
jgi:hypothetical protein